eukprot:gene2373-3211_t
MQRAGRPATNAGPSTTRIPTGRSFIARSSPPPAQPDQRASGVIAFDQPIERGERVVDTPNGLSARVIRSKAVKSVRRRRAPRAGRTDQGADDLPLGHRLSPPHLNHGTLLTCSLAGHRGWTPQWRDAAPKPEYDIVIVGGGGHGLATAYYLARKYGLKNIAVLEKSWIGSGNIGRNTTIIRSNYLLSGNIPLYELSLKLWEGLEQDFNYNAMVSQRGVLNLFHSDGQRDAYARRGNMMMLHGADAELLDRDGVKKLYPFLNFDAARFPIQGGLLQKRGGTVRHDAAAVLDTVMMDGHAGWK